jgi:hypothetical protein
MTSPQNATTTDDGRFYTWPPTGEEFVSITTITKGGTPAGPGLKYWAPKLVAECAVRNAKLIAALKEKAGTNGV